VSALPSIYVGGKTIVDKTKDILLERGIEKVGYESGKRAKALLDKVNPKMSASLENALKSVSKNSEDLKAKEELKSEILKLLMKDADLAREIEITVNLIVENVDQLVVGNYNNFFNFGTPSGNEYIKIIEYIDQRRKEATNLEILSRYSPSSLPNYPERLKKFVTENRSDEIREALIYIENHRILFLSGVAGVGKTTLARTLVDFRPINVPEPFWFSYYDNQDATLGDILEKLASYLNAPEVAEFKTEKREPRKFDVDKLTDDLQRRNQVWLIFDDLDTILEDRQFCDKGIELLFSSLRYNTHNAKIIITSRILPKLKNGKTLIDLVEGEKKYKLNGLRTNHAVDYLATNGLENIESEKLEKLAVGVDCHPLALELVLELVNEHGVNDTIEDLSNYEGSKEETIDKARRLFDKLAGTEKELLERISVYREPVSINGLKEMFTKNTPKNVINKLINKSLLETDHHGSYWLHPLIRAFSYCDLANNKEVHMIAYKYYSSLPLPKNPTGKEELHPAIEAHYQACKAEEYELAVQVIYFSNLHVYLDLWGDYTTLMLLYWHLLPDYPFNDEVILSKQIPELKDYKPGPDKPLKYKAILSNDMMSFVFCEIGSIYRQQGYVTKAIEYHEQALRIAREIEDRRGEGTSLGNLGTAYLDLGETSKAIEYYEQALKISKEIGDRSGEENSLGNLGTAYLDLGETSKAIEYYEQALKSAKETSNRNGEAVWLGNMGLAYMDLGELRKTIEYYEQALKISKEIRDRSGEAVWLGNLGKVYHDLGELGKAIEYYEQALKISKEIGDNRREKIWLRNLVKVHYVLGEFTKADEYDTLLETYRRREREIEEYLMNEDMNEDMNFGSSDHCHRHYDYRW
jgi:tetratricopeptide (TPR) repeat protein